MMQTWAILLDGYRELNARKLFWLVLMVSGLIVGVFAAIGLNEKGLTVLWWEFPSPFFNTSIMPAPEFYKLIFINLGVKFWLGWLAAILALVSTAGMIPDFIAGGAIELTLSKPIGRLRLFLTKYAAGLLFVALQVGVFALASFLVIGLRGGAWERGLFLAVPLVVVFFSYLYAVCALLGLLTRSTIASLLLTLGFWFACFGLHATEQLFSGMRLQRIMEIESGEREREAAAKALAELEAAPAPEPGDETKRAADLERRRAKLADIDKDLAETRESERWFGQWSFGLLAAKTILPKTSETTDLLERALVKNLNSRLAGEEMEDESPRRRGSPLPLGRGKFAVRTQDYMKRVGELQQSRSVWWILGTSLAFEAAVLAAAGWIFRQRDF